MLGLIVHPLIIWTKVFNPEINRKTILLLDSGEDDKFIGIRLATSMIASYFCPSCEFRCAISPRSLPDDKIMEPLDCGTGPDALFPVPGTPQDILQGA